ncbi:MAG: M20 family metallopeptidase [Ancrocorticia sp.]|jgi:glutamate carboxypeptidase|nr:M20 family metallopeptidase [Ancrocorticia sp.]
MMASSATAELLAQIRRWVEIESPTDDPAAVTRLANYAGDQLEQLGLDVQLQRVSGFGDRVLARTSADRVGILIVGHTDTVWPIGAKSFAIDGNKAFGPGIYDMKAGACIAIAALRDALGQARRSMLPVTMLLTSDEEVSSPQSRGLIEELSQRSDAVLVFEPSGPHGAIKTSRSGTARFVVDIEGRAAHSGADHAHGRSAVVALADTIMALEGMTDYQKGLTVNVGVVSGGTRPNVVPAHATAAVDVRAVRATDMQKAVAAISALHSQRPDITISVHGGVTRPPFERGTTAQLFEAVQCAARASGFTLTESHSGGGSDGNLAAAVGARVLDGLGAVGGGAHADDEYIDITMLARQVEQASFLLRTIRPRTDSAHA